MKKIAVDYREEMKMEIAETLRMVTKHAQQVDELPDYLASRIFVIADLLSSVPYNGSDIDELTEQVTLYDSYAQTGYLGMGVNHLILEKTIRKIEEQLSV